MYCSCSCSWELLQNPHSLLTFDKVHNPLHLPRNTTSEGPEGVRNPQRALPQTAALNVGPSSNYRQQLKKGPCKPCTAAMARAPLQRQNASDGDLPMADLEDTTVKDNLCSRRSATGSWWVASSVEAIGSGRRPDKGKGHTSDTRLWDHGRCVCHDAMSLS